MRADAVANQVCYRFALIGADLEQDVGARAADGRKLRQQATNGIQPVSAAVQSQARLKAAHFQRGQIARGDVGQIRHEQINLKAAFDQWLSQIAFEKSHVGAVADGILARDRQRCAADLAGIDLCRRSLTRECNGERAAARPDVGHSEVSPAFTETKRFFQQQFGLGPRDQHRGRDAQLDVVEAFDASDIGDWFAGGAALDSGLKAGRLVIRKERFRAREKETAIDAEDMGEQCLRIEIGRFRWLPARCAPRARLSARS